MPTGVHLNPVAPVCFLFLNLNSKFQTPPGKLKAKNKDFSALQRPGFNPTATIWGFHKRFLRFVQTSKAWDQSLQTFCFTMAVFYCCINRCAHMLLILPWVHTFSAWVNRAVRVWPVIRCDCALHGQWSSELSSGSSCSVTVSAASPVWSISSQGAFDSTQYLNKTSHVFCCLCCSTTYEWTKHVHTMTDKCKTVLLDLLYLL